MISGTDFTGSVVSLSLALRFTWSLWNYWDRACCIKRRCKAWDSRRSRNERRETYSLFISRDFFNILWETTPGSRHRPLRSYLLTFGDMWTRDDSLATLSQPPVTETYWLLRDTYFHRYDPRNILITKRSDFLSFTDIC